jgi:hypothetical protein
MNTGSVTPYSGTLRRGPWRGPWRVCQATYRATFPTAILLVCLLTACTAPPALNATPLSQPGGAQNATTIPPVATVTVARAAEPTTAVAILPTPIAVVVTPTAAFGSPATKVATTTLKAELAFMSPLTLPIGSLVAAKPVAAGQYGFQRPERGFLAQQPRKQSGVAATDQNQFLILFPELRDMPAPAWLKEGARVTYPVDSATIAQQPDATGSSGAAYVWVFEESTGLLLMYRHDIGKYNGTYSFQLPDSEPTPLPIQVTARVTNSSDRWTVFQMSSQMQSQLPDKSFRATGLTQLIDALWLPPEALSRIRNGQVLDRDPVTGAQITATRSNGAIVLTEKGRGYTTVVTYDSSDGTMVGMQQTMPTGPGTIQITVQLAGR